MVDLSFDNELSWFALFNNNIIDPTNENTNLESGYCQLPKFTHPYESTLSQKAYCDVMQNTSPHDAVFANLIDNFLQNTILI